MKQPGTIFTKSFSLAAGALLASLALAVRAADYPAPKEGDWVARDFRFHTGEVFSQVRLH
jgi:homoserine O-acetyltransferase